MIPLVLNQAKAEGNWGGFFAAISAHEAASRLIWGCFFRGDGLQWINNFLGFGVHAVPKRPDFGFRLLRFSRAVGVTHSRE